MFVWGVWKLLEYVQMLFQRPAVRFFHRPPWEQMTGCELSMAKPRSFFLLNLYGCFLLYGRSNTEYLLFIFFFFFAIFGFYPYETEVKHSGFVRMVVTPRSMGLESQVTLAKVDREKKIKELKARQNLQSSFQFLRSFFPTLGVLPIKLRGGLGQPPETWNQVP